MGCINSTKKLNDLKNENVFRAVQLHSDLPDLARTGFLELNARELIFRTGPNQRVVWALQHLRRYGLNGDVFSFEAGRRCMTGPGIYTFRCQQADQLYQLFQSYINAVSLVTDDAFAFGERERDHPSHILARPDNSQHTNNYLEPAPIITAGTAFSILHRSRALRDSFSNSPLSLDSPSSVPSLPFTTNEVVNFQSPYYISVRGLYVNTPNCAGVNANSNVYSEHPLRTQVEHNNNLSSTPNSVFNTLSRKNVVKHSSLDIPPEECAPILTPPPDALHMYANVEGGTFVGSNFGNAEGGGMRKPQRDPERCYENLNNANLNLLLQRQSATSNLKGQETKTTDMQQDQKKQKEPSTGTSGVNYIVLDLDQPRSPTQCTSKANFGSGLSLPAVENNEEDLNVYSKMDVSTNISHTTAIATTSTTSTTKTTKQKGENSGHEQLEQKEESALGYSTIDFIKTCALIKSSTHVSDFDAEPGNEECRITRHSKCMRKAYSISE